MRKKTMLRLVVLALAAVLLLAGTALAANYTITAPSNGHTYAVYQIFTGDYSDSDGILSNIKWGQNSANRGEASVGDAVPDTVIEELTATTGSDTEKLAVISSYVNLESPAFGTITNGNALTVPGGYYLIKDVDNSLEADANDSYTLYIVEVVNNVTIKPKADVPEFEKKVQDINDSTDAAASGWQDSADHDIGDTVNFQLKGTVASDYGNYETYKFVFHDQQSDGLTFDPDSVVVKVDDVKIETDFEVVTQGLDDGCTFEIVFENLKSISAVKANSVITVAYQSTLNERAAIGAAGNPNTAHLEFSNNPNDAQGGETGTTPDDTVIVFTYRTVVNKIDDNEAPLTGAAFKLEKKLQDGTWSSVKEFTVDAENPSSTFEFAGLDDGSYRLTETVTPDGYNTIAPIEFTITAAHDVTSDHPALTDLSGSVTTGEIVFASDSAAGSLTTSVQNNKGSTLPETGGMGTTIFYVVGGLLVVGAVVLLITKKRMSQKS